jgi:hypothetical protein
MAFLTPLEVDGVTIAGLALRGVCYQHRPDEAVMLQMEAAMPGLRTRVPLVRLDWRPATGGHKNPRRGPDLHAKRFITGSHLHPFELNWLFAAEVMRTGNLPFATAVSPDPNDFAEVLDLVGSVFRISNISLIETPSWSRKLL